MRKIFSLVVVAAITAGLATGAEAKGRCGIGTAGINGRQQHQQKRIYRGVRSDELTNRETFRLEREQFGIRREERRAKSDGVLTARERAQLQKDLNQASRHIYRAKHNARDRN
ncbi:MAG TPA: hypothetical protein VM934_11530 [Pyrinomonadaceae bacterium]|nr:hypothetical protein [Pyrinomonadaceae bacterium]